MLEQRGVLSPDELHRLMQKTRRALGAGRGNKGNSHNDVVGARLVQLRKKDDEDAE